MKPAPFDYHRPDSVAAAAEMLAEFGEESKVLAGGQSLVPMLALRLAFFDHLIDISRLDELNGIERQDGAVWIGGGHHRRRCRCRRRDQGRGAAAHSSHPVRRSFSDPQPWYVRRLDRTRRSRGRVSGGRVGPRRRDGSRVTDEDSGGSPRRSSSPGCGKPRWNTTKFSPGSRFPVWTGRCGFAVQEFARRHGDFAIAGAVMAVALDDDDRMSRCAIGLLGLGSTPRRAT